MVGMPEATLHASLPAARSPPTRALAHRVQELASVASLIAQEASQLALLHGGDGHDARVAQRAARHANEAARQVHAAGASADDAIENATWALTSAAVAITQAKLHAAPRREP